MLIRIRTGNAGHFVVTPNPKFNPGLPETMENSKFYLLTIGERSVEQTFPMLNHTSRSISLAKGSLMVMRNHDTFTFVNNSMHETIDISMELRSAGIRIAADALEHNLAFLSRHSVANWGEDARHDGSPELLPRRATFGLTQEGKLIRLPDAPLEGFVVPVGFAYRTDTGLNCSCNAPNLTSPRGYAILEQILQQTVGAFNLQLQPSLKA
jgi:hypothetical protein